MTQFTSNYFDVKKAGQLVYYFLHQASRRGANITKLRLAKWLYLAERASYKEFGVPMIGDRLCSMRHGPAPSELVSIIEGKNKTFDAVLFGNIFEVVKENKHQYIHLVKDCSYSSIDDLDRFSTAEIELLDGVWDKYGHWSARKLEDHLHNKRFFPEWDWKEGDGTNWIDIETILASVGFDGKDINLMVENIMAFDAVGPSKYVHQ